MADFSGMTGVSSDVSSPWMGQGYSSTNMTQNNPRGSVAALDSKDQYTSYTVVRGDTLSKIANTFAMSWRLLFAANQDQIQDPNLIYPGQVLKIPNSEWVASRQKAKYPKPVAPKTPLEHDTYYSVKSGDTLTSIAAQYENQSPETLFAANRAILFSPNLIEVGTQLLLPTYRPIDNYNCTYAGETLEVYWLNVAAAPKKVRVEVHTEGSIQEKNKSMQALSEVINALELQGISVNSADINLNESGNLVNVIVTTRIGKFIFDKTIDLAALNPQALTLVKKYKTPEALLLSDSVTWKPFMLSPSYRWINYKENGQIHYTYNAHDLGMSKEKDFSVYFEFEPSFAKQDYYHPQTNQAQVDFDLLPPHYLNTLNSVSFWLNDGGIDLPENQKDKLKYIHVTTLGSIDKNHLRVKIELLDESRIALNEPVELILSGVGFLPANEFASR